MLKRKKRDLRRAVFKEESLEKRKGKKERGNSMFEKLIPKSKKQNLDSIPTLSQKDETPSRMGRTRKKQTRAKEPIEPVITLTPAQISEQKIRRFKRSIGNGSVNILKEMIRLSGLEPDKKTKGIVLNESRRFGISTIQEFGYVTSFKNVTYFLYFENEQLKSKNEVSDLHISLIEEGFDIRLASFNELKEHSYKLGFGVDKIEWNPSILGNREMKEELEQAVVMMVKKFKNSLKDSAMIDEIETPIIQEKARTKNEEYEAMTKLQKALFPTAVKETPAETETSKPKTEKEEIPKVEVKKEETKKVEVPKVETPKQEVKPVPAKPEVPKETVKPVASKPEVKKEAPKPVTQKTEVKKEVPKVETPKAEVKKETPKKEPVSTTTETKASTRSRTARNRQGAGTTKKDLA